MALNFGSQFVVAAHRYPGRKMVNGAAYINGGRMATEKELFSWAKECENRGAGEILFTSMNHDDRKNGFACEALAKLSESLSIPVSFRRPGNMEHFAEVFTKGKADAGLEPASSISMKPCHSSNIILPNAISRLEYDH